MYSIVCVKQVRSNRFFTGETTGFRCSSDNELFNNPSDLAAVSWAVQCKKNYGFPVITVSMGPPSVMPQIRQLFSYGVDRALLLTSPDLSGSDTYATAYALGKAIETFLPDFGFILCGNKSLDGETGQVPHSLAVKLGIDSFANISNISFQNEQCKMILKMNAAWYQVMHRGKVLITVEQGPEGYLCMPKIKNIIDSKKKDIEVISCSDSFLSKEKIGSAGSYTKVMSVQNKKTYVKRKVSKIYFEEEQRKIDELLNTILGGVL